MVGVLCDVFCVLVAVPIRSVVFAFSRRLTVSCASHLVLVLHDRIAAYNFEQSISNIRAEFERKILQGSVDYRNWQYSKDAKDFCQETMMINAGFRLSAASALIHPWMNFGKKGDDKKKTLPVELVTSFNLYRIAPPLKRIALNALALKSTSSMYDSIFERLNKSNSGILSKEELVEGFKYSGNSEEELDDLFEKLVRIVVHFFLEHCCAM